MIRKLPNLIKIVLYLFIFVTFVSYTSPVFAQIGDGSNSALTTSFVKDQEVTFVGKTATRANNFLKWTLSEENYRWITLPTGSTTDPIQQFWALVRNIVFALLALFVLGAAFVMIITRGQNLTVTRFIPLFLMIIVLIYFSFATIRFFYQATDVVQGFFLAVPSLDDPKITKNIGPEDLLYIAFDYENFIGYRIPGIEFDESAFISLLLVKLTAITYYAMTGILLIRKIILWFFLIVSPVFPLLLFFRPIRNTAKIWIGEFFRWLLYAPLFALFLHGLVNVWRSGIPMHFDFASVGGKQVYPTAINILLGGPGQQIDINNSVNLSDTFALYVVALLMLWVVILLPFLLLQIFLDYLSSVSISANPVIKKITTNSWFNRAYGGTPPPSPPGQPPQKPSPFGLGKTLPFFNKRAMDIPTMRAASTLNQVATTNLQTVRDTKDVLRLANLTIPKMRDIARYETSMTKKDTASRMEVNRFHESLEKISKPTTAGGMIDREKFTTIKEKLVDNKRQGDPLAASILTATNLSTQKTQIVRENTTSIVSQALHNIVSPELAQTQDEKAKFSQIKQQLVEEKEKGDSFATTILEAANNVENSTLSKEGKETTVQKVIERLHEEAKKGNKLAASIMVGRESDVSQVLLPKVNQVQQVSIEEYEDVKKMWQENYQNMETPVGFNGIPTDKHSFIQQDIENITETINLLSSENQANVDKGMDRVANILPFLLIGGFSKTEVISYLKAKLEAAKTVMTSVDSKSDEEDTKVDRRDDLKTGHEEMVMREALPVEEQKSQDVESEQEGSPGVSNQNK